MEMLVSTSAVNFDLARVPGVFNPGGGMGVKYARVEEVLRARFPSIRRVSSLDSCGDDVIVDALWFVGKRAKRVEAFLEQDFRSVLLYGSQEYLVEWPHEERQRLFESVTWVTHNCAYQLALYRATGIYQSQFLCDPVPEHLFYPAKKVPRIVAIAIRQPHYRLLLAR